MSQQQSLEQKRAKAAWAKVEQMRTKSYAKEYGQLAKSAPAAIQTNGLGQTLAFLRAKGSKDGRPKDGGDNAHWKLQEHISEWVLGYLSQTHTNGLLGWVMAENTSTDEYRRATAETMAFLSWLKRFAEAELGE